MAHDVFISYSSIDKEAADAVCSILEESGISCWMAPRNITPGVPFAEAIVNAIKESKVFVLIYSSNSNNSTQVIREVDRAVHNGLSIITLRLENMPLSTQLEYYISNVHWLDAIAPPLEQHINQLSKVVQMLLAKDEVKDDDIEKAIRDGTLRLGKTTKPMTGAGRYKSPWKRAVMPIAVIIVLLIAALLLIPPLIKQKLSLSSTEIGKSIAVLPFDNLSNDPEQVYFSDGLVEEILDRLCKIGDLKVISRTSSGRFKDSDLSLKEIADLLGASAIMNGSVQKSNNRIRIVVQLIDAETDTHLWSRIFEQDYSDIFSIYSDVAQAVAGEMKVVITPYEKQLVEKMPTTDMTAYDAYLKGIFHLNILTEEDVDIAMQYFELAKESDPGFALAYSGIASVWIFRQQMLIVKVSEAAPLSETAIMKALELDSTLSEVHRTLALKRVWTDWDWEGGEESFRKAIEIDPNNAEARRGYSTLLNVLGRLDEAMEQIEIALELDPLNPVIWFRYGWSLIFSRRFDEAIEAIQEALELNPRHGGALAILDWALYIAGRDQEEVKEALRTFINVDLKDPAFIDIMETYYPEGGYPLVYKKIADLIVTRPDSFNISLFDISGFYIIAGDIDNAIYWMERAYEERDPYLPFLLHPLYDILRDDPRFQEIARKMNLPHKPNYTIQRL